MAINFYATGCSYIAHANFTGTDPYPSGIPCPILGVSGITGTITIRANEVTFDDGYGFPAYVYVNGTQIDYLQSTSVSFSSSGVTNVQVVATRTSSTVKNYVQISKGTGISRVSYQYYSDNTLYSGSSTNSLISITADVGSDITITGFTYTASHYGTPVDFAEYTSASHTTLITRWNYPDDPRIRVKSTVRYFVFTASKQEQTFYGRLRLNGNGGTFSNGRYTAINWPRIGYQAAKNDSDNVYMYISLPAAGDADGTPIRSGYRLLGWSTNSAATAPAFSIGGAVGFSVTSTDPNNPTEAPPLYAVWEKRPDIALFFWSGSDTADASLVAKGQPVSNITALRWNNLLAKIKELADAVGVPFSYTTVSSGDGITAVRFNVARNGLSDIKAALGTTTVLPAEQSKGGTIYASLFVGGGSIKSALNALIGVYNNG